MPWLIKLNTNTKSVYITNPIGLAVSNLPKKGTCSYFQLDDPCFGLRVNYFNKGRSIKTWEEVFFSIRRVWHESVLTWRWHLGGYRGLFHNALSQKGVCGNLWAFIVEWQHMCQMSML